MWAKPALNSMKVPGSGRLKLVPRMLDLRYDTAFGERTPDAYERLLTDVIRGDQTLFWDESNWQSLCQPCHDRKTVGDGRWRRQSWGEQHRRRYRGCDIHGMPLDPEHPWNRYSPGGR